MNTRLYAKVVLKEHPVCITVGDVIRTHRLKHVVQGDVISLSRCWEIGNRHYTLKGSYLINPRWFSIKAVVLSHDRGAKVKTQQKRQRKGRRPKKCIKPHETSLRVVEIKLKPEALLQK